MAVILNRASVAQAALANNARDLSDAMTKLSTGKRINSAGTTRQTWR